MAKWINPSGTPTYFAWRNMRSRCTNSTHAGWCNYGGRGIAVCSEWDSYDQFFKDMGPRPTGLTLERLDTNKGYRPGNCAWVTMRDNLNNRRNTARLAGVPITVVAQLTGIKPDTLRKRQQRGIDSSRILQHKLNLPQPADHGTRQRYERDGCRCAKCKSFNAARARAFRLRSRHRLDGDTASPDARCVLVPDQQLDEHHQP